MKKMFKVFLSLGLVFTLICSICAVSSLLAASTPITDVQVGTYQTNSGSHGDTFDPTWAEDDYLYCAGNDGYGFNFNTSYDNLNFNRLSGSSPTSLSGIRYESLHGYDPGGSDGGFGDGRNWKSSGTLCLNGTLYQAISRAMYQDPNYGGRQSHLKGSIIKSTDKGQSWTRDEATNYNSPMFSSQRFATPFFIHYGQNGAASVDNADNYVYAISNNGFWDDGDNYILGRVARTKIANLSAVDWQFYTGGDGMLSSNWSSDMNSAQLIINDPEKCGETGATYIPALERYILVAWYYPNGNGHGLYINETCFAFWESSKPWGPWTKVKTVTNNPSGWYVPRVLAKFQSQSGSDVNAYITCAGNWSDNYNYTDSRNHFYKFSVIPITLKTGSGGGGTTTVDDYTTGAGTNQFEYVGSWAGQSIRPSAYNSTEHFTNISNDYLQVRFNGTQIKFYSSKAADMGKAAVSIDGGSETIVDFYNSSQQWQQLIYTSPTLSNTSHTLKVRLNGQKNTSSTEYWVCADKVEITSGGSTPAPTSTPTPTPAAGGNLVTNPGFEANGGYSQTINGWSTWSNNGQEAADYVENNNPKSGTYHLTHYKDTTPYGVYTYQIFSNLQSGNYTLKAWVRNSGGQSACYMEAKDYGGSARTANLPVTGSYQQISITDINVTNGSCTIGFWSDTGSANNWEWCTMDDVEFYKQ